MGSTLPATESAALHLGEVFERVQQLTAQLADGVDPADIATTRRVPATITERASMLASSVA